MVTQPKRVGVSDSIRLRMEPRQTRSSHRIVELLDGAASHIHQHGFETMTTQDVATASGNSIGTLYRFFGDRIDVLDALVVRNVERAGQALTTAIRNTPPRTMGQLADCLCDVLVTMFTKEPGFKSIRLGDCVDIRPAKPSRWGLKAFSSIAADAAEQQGMSLTTSDRDNLELALDVADALLAKAFLLAPKGDKVTIEKARAAARLMAEGTVRPGR